MNNPFKHKNLPWMILLAGILGAALRAWLFATGMDSKGLLSDRHAGHWLIWLLTVAALALLIFFTKDLKQAGKYSFNFPASLAGAIGAAAAAVGVLVTSMDGLFSAGDGLVRLDAIAGLLSACVLAFLGYCRWKGKHPSVLFHGMICLYLMLHMVCQYRQWSSEPQIQNYCFSLLATVSILLACYCSAAFAANAGKRQSHTLFHLAAVYFCLVSLPHCDTPLFYLTMGAWMFTDQCSLIPMAHAGRRER